MGLGLVGDHAADMVICSSEGCDESGGVDSLVGVPGDHHTGGSPLHKHVKTPPAVHF